MDSSVTFFLVYFLFIALMFLVIKIRAFIKLGIMVVFRKHHIAMIFTNSRNIRYHAVAPENMKFELDDSTYFLSPAKIWYMTILEKLRIKRVEPVTTEELKKVKTYNIGQSNSYRFSNAPVSIYTEDNPEPIDIYNLKKDEEMTISGKYLSNIIKQAQTVSSIDIIAQIRKMLPYVIIVAVILAMAILYFVIYGLTPQIASGSGVAPPLGTPL